MPSLEEILTELERRRLMAGGQNPMPGAVNPEAFPAIIGTQQPMSLRDIINAARVPNPNQRVQQPPIVGGVRG